jgi:hypothetical protein
MIALHKPYSWFRKSVDIVMSRQLLKKDGIEDEVCDKCLERKAELFQATGEYCLSCWQDMTHPTV